MSILLAIVISLWAAVSWAEPSVTSVSESMSQGNQVTIAGIGFGSHADHNDARPYLAAGWENFETGAADSIFTANYGPELETNTALQKANSNYAARGYRWATPHAYTNVWGQAKNTETMYGFHLPLATFQKKIFISGWYMFPEGFGTGINYQWGDADQTKFLCMTPIGTLSGSDGAKTYFQTRQDLVDIPLRTETEDGYLSEGNDDPLFNYSPMGTWHRFDIYVDLTKPEGQKIHNWYVDGKKLPRVHEFYNADANLTSAGVINGFNYLSWLMYQFAGDDTYTWFQYMDDAFANLTQARVEISESATWDETAQTHKEIQIPLSWSNTEIVVSANLGSFDPGATLYLYVIDDDGAVSPGVAINVPGEPPIPPAAGAASLSGPQGAGLGGAGSVTIQ